MLNRVDFHGHEENCDLGGTFGANSIEGVIASQLLPGESERQTPSSQGRAALRFLFLRSTN
jgi:hypothetical protein